MKTAGTLDVEHQYFKTNGIRLHAAVQGPPEESRRGTIVFLHGFPEFWYTWKAQIVEFARDFRVVAPDLRGYNLSDKPEGVENYKVRTVVEDIAGLVAALGEEKIILVAHDWGGSIAWAVAAFHPELLEKLIIVNAAHPTMFIRDSITNPAQQAKSQYIHMLRSAEGEEILARNDYERLKQFLMENMANSDDLPEEKIARYVEAWSQPGALTGMQNYYRAMPAPPPKQEEDGTAAKPTEDDIALDESRIPKIMIHVPTLVVWGMKDTALLPTLLEGLDEYVPDLKIVRIPDATHWVTHERPDELNRAMRDYLG